MDDRQMAEGWYNKLLLRISAQGIAAASFFEVREKDIAESPTRRDAPNKKD